MEKIKENVAAKYEQASEWVKDHKKVVLGLLLLLLILGGIIIWLTATSASDDKPEDKTPEVEEKEEKIEEENEDSSENGSSKSGKSHGNGINAIDVGGNNAGANAKSGVTSTSEVTLLLEVRKNNPVVNSTSVSAETFGAYVTRNGKDVSNQCTISVDSSALNGAANGIHDVTIAANCGNLGSASRVAGVNLYIPRADEKQVAQNSSDTTHVATNGNSNAKTTADAQELVEIILIMNGVERHFIKDSIENVYAAQVKKVYTYIPGNMTVEGNVVTLAGRTFHEV